MGVLGKSTHPWRTGRESRYERLAISFVERIQSKSGINTVISRHTCCGIERLDAAATTVRAPDVV